MSNIETKDVIIAGLGIGGLFWMNHKLTSERHARAAAEQQRDCAHACADRAKRPATGLANASTGGSTVSRLAPRTFDQIFATFGQGLPVPYLRALALRESGMNPRSASGAAWGLLQVIEVVRDDHNKRTGSRYTRQDLLDPAINVAIAASALATIIRSYAQNHPRIRNLHADWHNPRFVELLTFGWNAGWSERGGVGRVSSYLEQRGVLDQTIDVVHQASKAAGASPHLADAAKVAWCKSVAAQYLRELAAERPLIEMPEEYVGRPALIVTGPITQPSQVVVSGPITSPSQVAAQPAMAPAVTAPQPDSAAKGITGAVAAATSTAMNPSGLGGPVDPYADCTCPA